MTALFGHRHRLLERPASGGMDDVWRASVEQLGRTVAVERLRAEARADAARMHPNIAGVQVPFEAESPSPAVPAHRTAYPAVVVGAGFPLPGSLPGGSLPAGSPDGAKTEETEASVSPTETPVTPEHTKQSPTTPARPHYDAAGSSVTITTTKLHTEPNLGSTTTRALGSDNKV